MKETELYESVRKYFTGLGFTVRAEVRDIDICAVRDDLLVGIELKRNFSTDLLIQAVQRQKVCDLVYIAVPKPKRVRKDRSFRNMLHMLSRLELGLLYVDIVTGSVSEVLEPAFYDLDKARRTMMRARRTILSEIKRRTLDGNVGGSNKTRLLTAYREESLKAVALIRHQGVIAPKDLKGIGIRPGLLNNNFYGWFRKIERGRYGLEAKKAADYAEYEVHIEGFLKAFEAAALEAMPQMESGIGETLQPPGEKEGLEGPSRGKRPGRKKPAAEPEMETAKKKGKPAQPKTPPALKKRKAAGEKPEKAAAGAKPLRTDGDGARKKPAGRRTEKTQDLEREPIA